MLPKQVKDKVSLMALQEAADAEMPEMEPRMKPKAMKPEMEQPMEVPVMLACPECGCQGTEEEFSPQEE